MTGSASTLRVLAGRPCPGDHFQHSNLVLSEADVAEASPASVQVRAPVGSGMHACATVQARGNVGVKSMLRMPPFARRSKACSMCRGCLRHYLLWHVYLATSWMLWLSTHLAPVHIIHCHLLCSQRL